MVVACNLDAIIGALADLAAKTSNNIDDKMVETIKVNRGEIMEEIKRKV